MKLQSLYKNITIKQANIISYQINSTNNSITQETLMVGYVNGMLDIINGKTQSLEELNVNLEERVRQKTVDIIEEKNFSQELLKSMK